MPAIDTQGKMTKQSAARQQVLELIRQLGVGTAIPSERQLSADLGVSRLTVRAALDDLAREGYLVRRRGSGTYVQQPKISMAIETLHVPAGVVPGLKPPDLEGSFYELLRARYGIEIATATQTIEPTVTNEDESAALGVPLHSPAFLFERTSRDAAGRTLEFVHSIYRGDRYQIVSELTPS